jgi:hypothetical protein
MMTFQRVMIERQQQAPANDHQPPWQRNGDHGLQFIRNVLHLHWRAWQAGHEIGAGAIGFAGQRYGLSAHWQYLRDIADEPARMADCDFQTIADAPYPDDFIQLWRDDFAKWFREHPQALFE